MYKDKIKLFLPYLFYFVCFLASCNKKPVEPLPKQNDQTASAATDASIEDINGFINYKIGGLSNATARIAAYNLPCGVIKIDSIKTGNKKIYSFQYGNQTLCGYKRKSGQINFQLINGNKFDSIGSKYTIEFINYKVEALANGDNIILNGKLIITNLQGGFIWQAVYQSKVIQHAIRGKLMITYGNGSIREREYFQKRTWSSTSGWSGLKYSVEGDTNIYNIKVLEIGKTYEGNYSYQTQLLKIFTWSNCGTDFYGPYILKVGEAKMNINIPNVTPSYFKIEAGYFRDPNLQTDFILSNDCLSNAYKITTQVGTTTNTQYQYY